MRLKWSPRPDLNWWPPRYQRGALPTELHGQEWWGCLDSNQGTQRERIYSPPQLPLCHIPIPFSSTTCQRKPRRRAYSCHKTYTRGGRGMLPSPLSFAFGSAARCAGCDKVHTRGAGDVALPAQLRLRLSRSLRSRIAGRATSPASSALWIAEIMSWLQLNLACKGLLTETPPRDRGCV